MKQFFTTDHLIHFLYNETTASEAIAIKEELDTNYSFREEYEILLGAYNQLPKVTFSPSENSVKNILNHSKSAALENHVWGKIKGWAKALNVFQH